MFSSQMSHQLQYFHLHLVSLALILSNICTGNPVLEGGRIYHGEEVHSGQWPFMVALMFKDGEGYMHFCGGSILNDDSILTATHCAWADQERSKKNLTALPSDIFVYAGHTGIASLKQEYLYAVKEFIINPELASTRELVNVKESVYDVDFDVGHDVAVIKTVKKIKFEEGLVGPVCLPHAGARVIGDRCITMGWGVKDNPKIDSSILYQVEIPIMEECIDHPEHDPSQLICAGNIKYQKDACQVRSVHLLIQQYFNLLSLL